MLTLNDGPCKGTFMVKRAPVFLRAVIDAKGETDVLDQVEDTPKKTEKIYIYKRIGEASVCHIKMVKRSESGYYVMADYWQIIDLDGEQFRDNATWQEWATAALAKLQAQETMLFTCPVDFKDCDRKFKTCCSCLRNNTNVLSKGD